MTEAVNRSQQNVQLTPQTACEAYRHIQEEITKQTKPLAELQKKADQSQPAAIAILKAYNNVREKLGSDPASTTKQLIRLAQEGIDKVCPANHPKP